MGKKLKIQKKNASDSNPKTIDFSSLVEQTNEKLSHQNFPEISLNTVNFTINPSGSDLEKKYHKKFIGYLHNEFNAKIIKMYFNYISSTKIIKPIIKDNRPFLIDFLKIITNLLMNEIDLSAMAYLLENKVKWIEENETDLMWNHLYNVCLKAKQLTSSNEIYTILLNLLEEKNPGFKSYYNKWVVLKKCPDKIEIIDINKIYNQLMQSNYLNQNKNQFINYNAAVDKILEFSEKTVKNKKKRIKKTIGNKNLGRDNDIINNSNYMNNNCFPKINSPQESLVPPYDKIFEYNYYPSLNLSNGGSYENLGLLNIQRNSMAVTSRNFSNYGNMGYPNLNMSRNESGQSFNSSMNRQNN